jgi:hypothetical protein
LRKRRWACVRAASDSTDDPIMSHSRDSNQQWYGRKLVWARDATHRLQWCTSRDPVSHHRISWASIHVHLPEGIREQRDLHPLLEETRQSPVRRENQSRQSRPIDLPSMPTASPMTIPCWSIDI